MTLTASTVEAAAVAPDGTWVTLSGTVSKTSDDGFLLDYGVGAITIEMDDSDWYPEGRTSLENDEVVVYGFVDDDFYEKRTIEASSMYVEKLGTQFYASGVDEEDFPTVVAVPLDPKIQLTGKVSQVGDDTFQLSTATKVLKVDVDDPGLRSSRSGGLPTDQEGRSGPGVR